MSFLSINYNYYKYEDNDITTDTIDLWFKNSERMFEHLTVLQM